MMKTMRGQATTELALGSLIFVTIVIFGIYFGEVTFGALKVQEASNSALFDLTHYRTHSMNGFIYSTGPIGGAVAQTQANTFNDYQDFDGRTSAFALKSANIQHVFTKTTGMAVRCQRGGAPGYLANPLLAAAYLDNNGASCSTEADFLSFHIPTNVANNHGFFNLPQWTRASLKQCGAGKTTGGACRGRYSIMLDDWGLTGPNGGEWNPAPGMPMGLPSATNLSYWMTTYRAYLSNYWISALLFGGSTMMTLPASQLATLAGDGIHPMGIIFSIAIGGIPWNESTFYLSFDSGLTQFQHVLMAGAGSENGILGSIWETTPYVFSLMVTYAAAFIRRSGSGGCYLGTPC